MVPRDASPVKRCVAATVSESRSRAWAGHMRRTMEPGCDRLSTRSGCVVRDGRQPLESLFGVDDLMSRAARALPIPSHERLVDTRSWPDTGSDGAITGI